MYNDLRKIFKMVSEVGAVTKIAPRFLSPHTLRLTLATLLFFFFSALPAWAGTVTISGTTFSQALTVKMAVGTSTPSIHSFSSPNGNTNWSFTIDDTYLSSSTKYIFWLDDYTYKANLLVQGTTTDMSSLNLNIAGLITIDNKNYTRPFYLTDFNFIDSSFDEDLMYTFTATSTIFDSDFTNFDRGPVYAPEYLVFNSSSIINGLSSFRHNNGTVEIKGGGSGSVLQNFIGDSAFNKLIISGTDIKLAPELYNKNASTTDLLIKPGGSLKAPAHLTIAGNFTNHGSFDNNGGVMVVENEREGEDLLSSVGLLDTSTTINSLKVQGDYVFLAVDGTYAACSDNAGDNAGCSLLVFDISNPEKPVYVAGRDSSGGGSGFISGVNAWAVTIKNDYLFLGTQAHATNCVSVAGSATGCEILVFDISNPENPTFVAGRDSTGGSSGTGYSSISSLAVYSDYLIAGLSGNATACSQIPGSAIGCEIQIYDISNPASITYVAGMDVSGSKTGTDSKRVETLLAHNDYLFIGTQGSSIPCSQTPGSAIGCELQIYDISSSTNPVFVAGRDTDGSNNGANSSPVQSLAIEDDYLFVGRYANAAVCDGTAGGSLGCELQIYNISSSTNPVFITGVDLPVAHHTKSIIIKDSILFMERFALNITNPALPILVSSKNTSFYSADYYEDYIIFAGKIMSTSGWLSGNLSSSSSLNDLIIAKGKGAILDNASTTNITINASSTLVTPEALDISGNLTNHGILEAATGTTVRLTGDDQTLLGTTTFYNLVKNPESHATTTFEAGALYTILGDFDFSTTATDTQQVIQSSASGTAWYLDPQGLVTVNNLEVQDSHNVSVSTIYCLDGCFDGGENMKWRFDLMSLLGVIRGGLDGEAIEQEGIKVSVWVDGDLFSATTTANGEFSIEYAAGDSYDMVLFVEDEDTLKAVVFVKNPSQEELTGIDLYQNFVVVKNLAGTSTPISNADLAVYDGIQNSDITFVSDANGVFINSGQSLYIASSTTLAPTGTLKVAGSLVADEENEAKLVLGYNELILAADGVVVVDGVTDLGKASFKSGEYTLSALETITAKSVSVESEATVALPENLTTNALYNQGVLQSGAGEVVLGGEERETLTYVLGLDADATKTGVQNLSVIALVRQGNYLYIGKSGNSAICDPVGGSVQGCEVLIFDIASSTNPILKSGIDMSGTVGGGTSNYSTNALSISGEYLFIGKSGSDSSPCLQLAGSANRCEIIIMNVANPSAPYFVAGVDSNGGLNGTSTIQVNSLLVDGNYLYVAKNGSTTVCDPTAGNAVGCEVLIIDISNPATPFLVSGIDMSGGWNSGNESGLRAQSLVKVDDYLFIGKEGSSAQICQQTAGSANWCEVMIMNVANPSAPYFVAGVDSNGLNNGNTANQVNSLVVKDNYLFVGKTANANGCSAVNGQGCEVMIMDISSSTNPVLLGGIESSGNSLINESVEVRSLLISKNMLYVAKFGNAKSCHDVVYGLGCELMVFDISSSTNPILVALQDISGDKQGTLSLHGYALEVTKDGYVFLGTQNSNTPCSQVAGSAIGCELKVFSPVSGILAGDFMNSNRLNKIVAEETVLLVSSIAANNFTVSSSTTVVAASPLYLSGDLTNYGTFKQKESTGIYLEGAGTQSINGDFTGSSTLPALYLTGNSEVEVNGQLEAQNIFIGNGATLEAPAKLLVKNGIKNNGTFRHNDGEVIVGDDDKNYSFLWSLDADGSQGGSNSASVLSFVQKDNYLFVGLSGNVTNCAQNHVGCELKVFDISNPTKPVYMAGRDVAGLMAGSGQAIYALELVGDFLFVGKERSSTACSQVAGSATGCELIVFDVSNPTNPTFVTGLDADGSNSGVGFVHIRTLKAHNNLLFVGKNGDGTVCSSVAGSAVGCELIIFNISSSTNPVFLAGVDADGSASGSGNRSILDLYVVGDTLYTFNDGSSSACSSVEGGATGCELTLFDISNMPNITYLKGFENTGFTSGGGYESLNQAVRKDDYLFVAGNGHSEVCNLSTNNSRGCELKIFDVASSTNPILLAGRDVGGGKGMESINIKRIAISGNKLYVGKAGSSNSFCFSETEKGIGCELMVFDISSSTNPIYERGFDLALPGQTAIGVETLTVIGDVVIVGKTNNATPCSQIFGETLGCEMLSFYNGSLFEGNFSDSNALSDLTIAGHGVVLSEVFGIENDLVIENTGELVLGKNNNIVLGGNYQNDGSLMANKSVFTFVGENKTLSGNLTGSNAFYKMVLEGDYEIAANTASTTDILIKPTGALRAPGSTLTLSGSLTNLGSFDHNNGQLVVENVDGEIMSYVAGARTVRPNNSSSFVISKMTTDQTGRFLFVAKTFSPANCNSNSNIISGCELVVFDLLGGVPVPVAARDINGSASGAQAGLNYMSSVSVKDNFLFVTTSGTNASCSQVAGSAIGCELQVYDISNPANPIYRAGRDNNGAANGNTTGSYNNSLVVGDYLFLSSGRYTADCVEISGAAHGCALKVYDISSSTNPTFVAGRENNGTLYSLVNIGNYLLATKSGSGITSILVFDISNPANPVLVSEEDITASGYGKGVLAVVDDYLYVGVNESNSNYCYNQTCSIDIYDVSDLPNITFVGNHDDTGYMHTRDAVQYQNYLFVAGVSGVDCGGAGERCDMAVFEVTNPANPRFLFKTNSYKGIDQVVTFDDYLILGRGNSGGYCNNIERLCDISSFKINPHFIAGNLIENNSLGNLVMEKGKVKISDDAFVSNLSIKASSTLMTPEFLSLSGDLTNQGTLEVATGTTISLIGGDQTLTGTTTFYNLVKNPEINATTTFEAGALYTILGDFDFGTASSGVTQVIQSSVAGEEWYLDPQGRVMVNNLEVQDSHNVSVSTIYCLDGCVDRGENTRWKFDIPMALSSWTDNHFYRGQATTTLSDIALVMQKSNFIKNGTEIKLRIDATTTDFRFDSDQSELALSGTASGKVSGSVSVEDNGTTLVLIATSDWSVGEELILQNVQVGGFASVSTEPSQLFVTIDDNEEADAVDDKFVFITGAVTIGEHTLGQVESKFSFRNYHDEPVYRFSLEAVGEEVIMTNFVLSLAGVQGVVADNLQNWRLYRDENSDGVLDGGDTLLDGNGLIDISEQFGAVTFSQDFVLATGTKTDFLAVADVLGVPRDSLMMIGLRDIDLTLLGDESGLPPIMLGSVKPLQHWRVGAAGAGGGGNRVGTPAPDGAGVQDGGEADGGDKIEDEGDWSWWYDPNYYAPTSNKGGYNDWSFISQAFKPNSSFATAPGASLGLFLWQTVGSFNFNVPVGNVIEGVEIKIKAKAYEPYNVANISHLEMSLSWNNGGSWTSSFATQKIESKDYLFYTVGGPSELWGREWSVADFSNENFILRMKNIFNEEWGGYKNIETIQVRVYHTAGGGGAGGGERL